MSSTTLPTVAFNPAVCYQADIRGVPLPVRGAMDSEDVGFGVPAAVRTQKVESGCGRGRVVGYFHAACHFPDRFFSYA